jgi:hypothetical protein
MEAHPQTQNKDGAQKIKIISKADAIRKSIQKISGEEVDEEKIDFEKQFKQVSQ